MIELIKPGINIDFTRYYKYTIGASILTVLLGLLLPLTRGINYGIDFSGGTLIHLRFGQPVEVGAIREALGTLGSGDTGVQELGGGSKEFLVRLPEADPELREGFSNQVQARLGERFAGKSEFEVLRVESVGPRVGKDLRRKGFLAVAAATVAMGIYIAFRFEIRFGIGAAVALIHDVLVVFIFLCLFNYEFDLNIVAALLTIVGFSVNDNVVISDRIRENMRRNRREAFATLLNRAINETLSRTVLNSGTAIIVALALFLLGGEMIHGFAFALLVGFIVGTYSSIFIASPVVLYLDFKPRARTKAAA
ncbi:MAG: protein translocase subunit SecF [Candidatus Binatia bacterium]